MLCPSHPSCLSLWEDGLMDDALANLLARLSGEALLQLNPFPSSSDMLVGQCMVTLNIRAERSFAHGASSCLSDEEEGFAFLADLHISIRFHTRVKLRHWAGSAAGYCCGFSPCGGQRLNRMSCLGVYVCV